MSTQLSQLKCGTDRLRLLLEAGKVAGMTHLIILRDTITGRYCQWYVEPGTLVRESEIELSMDRGVEIMEIYDLSMDFDDQLAQVRTFNR